MMYYFLMPKYKRRYGMLPYDVNDYTTEICDKCGSILVKYSNTISFIIKGELCDYYMFDNLIFVSSRFLEVLNKYNIRNYSFKDANVYNNKELERLFSDDKKNYYELQVVGRCGFLQNLNNKILPVCSACGERIHNTGIITNGLSISNDYYDDSDLFAFSNLKTMPIVTERLKNILVNNHLTNIAFSPINNYIIDDR